MVLRVPGEKMVLKGNLRFTGLKSYNLNDFCISKNSQGKRPKIPYENFDYPRPVGPGVVLTGSNMFKGSNSTEVLMDRNRPSNNLGISQGKNLKFP